MAKANKITRRSDSQHHRTLHQVSSSSSCCSKVSDDVNHKKKRSRGSQKKDWKDASCSVCMEHPHNAVVLLCSSYDKGCRPYICATSRRYSNCLEQYKEAYTKVSGTKKTEISEVLCPLCRGEVKGWTVVEPARKYLNSKKRTCMHDKCSFVGTYRELRKHVRVEHPLARRPREVDPSLVEKWKKLENERELNDVFSTIRSTMPGAIVMGDYVIEAPRPRHGFSSFDDALFQLESLSERWNGGDDDVYSSDSDSDSDSEGYHYLEDDEFLVQRGSPTTGERRLDNYISQMNRYRSRMLLGRSPRQPRRGMSRRI